MARALSIVVALFVAAVAARADAAPTVDDLWKLAPSGTTHSVVIDGETLLAALDTAATVRGALVTSPTPELEAIARAVTTLRGVDMLSPDSLRAEGVDPAGGIGFFFVGEETVVAAAVTDEPRFLASSRQFSACVRRGALSACAKRKELLATVGTNTALATSVAQRPAHLRGGLEGALVNDGAPIPVAAQITRGRVQLGLQARLGWPLTEAPAPSPLTAHVAKSPATGVLAFDTRAMPDFTAGFTEPLRARGFGPLVDVLRGDVIAVALRGAPLRGWIRLGLRDVAGAKALLARCDELPWPAPIRARGKKGACELTGLAPGGVPLRLHVRVVGDTLVGETQRGAASERGTPEPRIAALLTRPWIAVMWGRGLGSAPALPDELSLDLHRILPWWLAHVDELGFAVGGKDGAVDIAVDLGTAWQNPDAVVAPLEQIIARFVAGESTHRSIVALTKQHPASRLAQDVAAGAGGLVLPLGILSALCDQLVPMLFPTAAPPL